MAYAIHIKRRAPDGEVLPIALSEWFAAVQQTENVRIAEGDFKTTNPNTGEIITLRNTGGDAEAFLPKSAKWMRLFVWSASGQVSFRAPRDFDLPTSDVRRLASQLAQALGASLIGDGGESYE